MDSQEWPESPRQLRQRREAEALYRFELMLHETGRSDFVYEAEEELFRFRALGYGLRPREAAVVLGMVLGDHSLIPEDLEEAFQRSGITHVIVSS